MFSRLTFSFDVQSFDFKSFDLEYFHVQFFTISHSTVNHSVVRSLVLQRSTRKTTKWKHCLNFLNSQCYEISQLWKYFGIFFAFIVHYIGFVFIWKFLKITVFNKVAYELQGLFEKVVKNYFKFTCRTAVHRCIAFKSQFTLIQKLTITLHIVLYFTAQKYSDTNNLFWRQKVSAECEKSLIHGGLTTKFIQLSWNM